jgi:predicted RND superfamily exporter protein
LRIWNLVITVVCWLLAGLGYYSLIVSIAVFLKQLRVSTSVGILAGVVGLLLLSASKILSSWWQRQRAADEARRGFPVLPPEGDKG